jgi:hypothetical protein
MKKATKRSFSYSCLFGALAGTIAGLYFHLPAIYYMFIWLLLVFGVSFYEPRSATVAKLRKLFGIKPKTHHYKHW